jgi:hypothetical protein
MNQPSQSAVNAMVRVLEGKPLKYTVTVHLPDGSKVEFQSTKAPVLKYNDEARGLWLSDGEYSSSAPIMPWPPGAIMLVEENPNLTP